jgi:hypothetical protein
MINTLTIARAFNIACKVRGALGQSAVFLLGCALARRAEETRAFNAELSPAESFYCKGIVAIQNAIREGRLPAWKWTEPKYPEQCESAGYSYAAGYPD